MLTGLRALRVGCAVRWRCTSLRWTLLRGVTSLCWVLVATSFFSLFWLRRADCAWTVWNPMTSKISRAAVYRIVFMISGFLLVEHLCLYKHKCNAKNRKCNYYVYGR
jgi:hypothetical protein